MIYDHQIVLISDNSYRTLTKILQAARFPCNRDLRMLFAEVLRGCQQGRQSAIMFPGYSAQSFRLSTLHFVRLLRRR